MARTKDTMEYKRHTRISYAMKLFFRHRFTIRETQQLILDGWIVAGDRKTAERNGKVITYQQTY